MADMRDQLVQNICSLAASQRDNDALQREFAMLISSIFNIDSVRIIDTANASIDNALHSYVFNTKKNMIDNQLSSYSAFPELISYKDLGYASACLMPVLIDGRVLVIVQMLSKDQNKFDNALLESLSSGTSLMAAILAYRKESARSSMLAGYFSATFETQQPQLLVSTSNTIVKANAAAKKLMDSKQTKSIKELLSLDANQLSQLEKGRYAHISIGNDANKASYDVYVTKVNDGLLNVCLNDVTNAETLTAVLGTMGSNQMGMILLSSAFTITYATPGVSQLLRHDPKMMVGERIEKLLTPNSWQQLSKLVSAPAKQNSGQNEYLDFITADTSIIHTRYSFAPSAQGFVLVFARAEDQAFLSKISATVNDIINNTSDVILKMDKLGFIIDCNIMAQNVLGYKKETLIGKDVKSLYMDQHHIERDLNYVIKGSKVEGSYINIIKADGSFMPATQAVFSLNSKQGELTYMAVIKELDTKNRMQEYESSIKKQRREIEALKGAGELKSQFLYNISHELKTPLTSIAGFAKLLYQGEFGPINEQQRDTTQILIDESGRLTFMINQVLDAVKLESNKVKLELKDVDLREFETSPSMKGLVDQATEKGLSFKYTVEFDVPKISADPNKLIQVLINLIGNATKFTDKGGISVRFFRKNKRTIQCDVADTGIGISDEDKRKIFKEFYQAPKAAMIKQEGSGTGLGLSITKYIVRLHHGKIWLESEPGKGTTFSFTLPITQPAKRKKQQQAN